MAIDHLAGRAVPTLPAVCVEIGQVEGRLGSDVVVEQGLPAQKPALVYVVVVEARAVFAAATSKVEFAFVFLVAVALVLDGRRAAGVDRGFYRGETVLAAAACELRGDRHPQVRQRGDGNRLIIWQGVGRREFIAAILNQSLIVKVLVLVDKLIAGFLRLGTNHGRDTALVEEILGEGACLFELAVVGDGIADVAQDVVERSAEPRIVLATAIGKFE